MEYTSSETGMIAKALEMPPQLLPYAAELLADFQELGSDASAIVAAIANLTVSPDATVIDLGCGKGFVAIEIAKTLGLKVHGIELYRPFVELCRQNARRANVEALCSFDFGDITKYAHGKEPYDIAVFSAIGDTLGSIADTIRIIRDYVKPGGYLIISDVYLTGTLGASNPHFSYIQTKESTQTELTAHGDRIAVVYDQFPDSTDEFAQQSLIQKAQQLALEHPEVAAELSAFVASQTQENQFIESSAQDVIWVVEKK